MESNYQEKNSVSDRRSGSDRRVFSDPDYNGSEKRIYRDRRKEKVKRKHRRFQAKELLFVKFSSEQDESIGQLLDISRGGLSFRYFTTEEKLPNYADLGIFSSDGEFNIEKIPIKIISDIETEKTSSGKQTLRRYGLQFDTLTPDQTSQLDYFLQNYTIGET